MHFLFRSPDDLRPSDNHANIDRGAKNQMYHLTSVKSAKWLKTPTKITIHIDNISRRHFVTFYYQAFPRLAITEKAWATRIGSLLDTIPEPARVIIETTISFMNFVCLLVCLSVATTRCQINKKSCVNTGNRREQARARRNCEKSEQRQTCLEY